MKKRIFTLLIGAVLTASLSWAQTARVQVIHNSADAAASTVDVWLNNTLLLDDFAFRTASPFVDAPAGVDIAIAIQPSSSTDTVGAIFRKTYNLTADETYILVANGIVSASGYDPAEAFDIYAFTPGQEEATTAGNTDVLVFHGATDAPAVDVVEVGVGAGTIVDALAYGNFNPYLNLTTADYVLDVQTDAGNNSVVQYSAPLSTLGLADSSIVVVASGFLNPANNSDGPAFGLYVALPEGGDLVPLPQVEDVTMNVKMAYKEFQGIFDPSSDFVDVAGSFNGWGGTPTVLTNVDDNVFTTTVWLTVGAEVEFKFRINGSWDDNTAEFPFGGPARKFTPTAGGDNTITVWYNDEAPTARVQVIHNSADAAAATVDVWLNNTLLIDDFAFRTASAFIDAPAVDAFDVVIQPSSSSDTTNALARFTYELDIEETYVLVANGIVSASGYDPVKPFDIYVYAMGQEEAATAGNTDVLVFHGATDAPAVDVLETSVPAGTIVDAMAYGEFNSAGYLELTTADYILEIQADADNSTVESYSAPLSSLGLADSAIVVVASGFLTPANNSSGEAFGLFAALAEGGALVALPLASSVSTEDILLDDFQVRAYPNPVSNYLNIEFTVERPGTVSMEFLSITGQTIMRRDLGQMNKGDYTQTIDVSSIQDGIYVLRMTAGEAMYISKVKVIK